MTPSQNCASIDDKLAALDQRAKKLRQPSRDLELIEVEREQLLEQKQREQDMVAEAQREVEAREQERLSLINWHAKLADAGSLFSGKTISWWLVEANRTISRAADLGVVLEPLVISVKQWRQPASYALPPPRGGRFATEVEIAESAERLEKIRAVMNESGPDGHPYTHAQAIAIVDGVQEEQTDA